MTGPDDDALTQRLQAAFPAEADPRDEALAQMIAAAEAPASTTVVTLMPRRARPAVAAIWGGLIAASFVAGVVIGPLVGSAPGAGFSVGPQGVLADAGLVKVLDRRLAADGPDGKGRAIGLTFRDTEGHWCRTFQAGDAGVAGLACREDGGWVLRALAPATAQAQGVRTAAADTPAVILSAVDASLSGETADAAAEAQARAAGWLGSAP